MVVTTHVMPVAKHPAAISYFPLNISRTALGSGYLLVTSMAGFSCHLTGLKTKTHQVSYYTMVKIQFPPSLHVCSVTGAIRPGGDIALAALEEGKPHSNGFHHRQVNMVTFNNRGD
jgi:hypothetical protein